MFPLSQRNALELSRTGDECKPPPMSPLISSQPRQVGSRVTRCDPILIREIDVGDRYGRSDVNRISIRMSKWNMGHQNGIWYIDMVIYRNHIDMVILDIDTGFGLLMWEMTVSIWSSPISIWDIFFTLRTTDTSDEITAHHTDA